MTPVMTSEDPPALDVVEQVIIAEDYSYERTLDGEIHFSAPGDWQSHPIWFAWSTGVETLHICLALESRVPEPRRKDACELLTMLNERTWLGHYEIWSDDGAVVYRNAMPLPGGVMPQPEQIAALIAGAIEAGERFYPAMNFLIWGKKTPREAVAAALFETAGEA